MVNSYFSRALSLFAIALSVSAYQFPKTKDSLMKPDADITNLQSMSRGISKIATITQKALVLITISKEAGQSSFGAVDPFEFFHNPDINHPKRQPPKNEGMGSGFIIDLKLGYVITNHHVVAQAKSIQLKLANGKTYNGQLVGSDQSSDIAVVQIKQKKFSRDGLVSLPLAVSSDVNIGELVLALGAPFGLEASVSLGIISAMGRGNLSITKLGDFLQTDAAINPGNSGGPLISMDGKVVGLNTAIFSRSGGYNGISFAVPASMIETVAMRLISQGVSPRGYLGAGMRDLDPATQKSLGVPEQVNGGAVIAQVVEGSPADAFGLKSGDVIVAIDGQQIQSASAATQRMALQKPGGMVTIQLYRQGEDLKSEVILGSIPAEYDFEASSTQSETRQKLGFDLSKNTPAAQQTFSLKSNSGFVVTNLSPDSSLFLAGLRVGDLILSIDGQEALLVDDVQAKLAGSNKQILRIERKGEYFFVEIER